MFSTTLAIGKYCPRIQPKRLFPQTQRACNLSPAKASSLQKRALILPEVFLGLTGSLLLSATLASSSGGMLWAMGGIALVIGVMLVMREIFIRKYQALDKFLRGVLPNAAKKPFSQLVNEGGGMIKLLNQHGDFFINCAGPRNLYAHRNSVFPGPFTLMKLCRLVNKIVSIQRLKEVFSKSHIDEWQETNSIWQVISYLHKKRFSQAVVRKTPVGSNDRGELALLTMRAINFWITKLPAILNGEKTGIDFLDEKSPLELTVGDFLKLQEICRQESGEKQYWKVMSGEAFVDEAYKAFSPDPVIGRVPTWAILLTDDGKADGKLIGIITTQDATVKAHQLLAAT